MKIYSFLLASCLILFFASCEKESKGCVKVKYITSYCPKLGSALVELVDSDDSENIALLDVPEEFRVRDKVFYVTYHYDEVRSKPDANVLCPAMFGPAEVYVADSASENECVD